MSLTAVQNAVAGMLDGLVAGSLPPAQAWVLPPPVTQPADYPQIYVWGGRLVEARATIPRGPGQKRINHRIDLYVHWTSDNSNDPNSVVAFPVLLDAIRHVMRSVPLPVELTDPVTGEVSNLTDFGENMVLDYSTPTATADQRWLMNVGAIRVNAYEWITA